MSKLKSLFVAVIFLILPTLIWAQTASSADLFQEGTRNYLAKDYKKARELFLQSLDKDPNNATTLTNLALSEYQLGNKPLSVGLLRKALAQDPELFAAQSGLRFTLSQIQTKEVPRQIEFYETLRTRLLQPVPLSAYLVLSAVSFFATGWILVSYGGRRKKALSEERALPVFPWVGGFLSLLFVIFTGLLALKVYDGNIVRGTIIDERVSLQTAPGDNQVAILDLYGGMEVIARKTQGEWVQVTYPGSLTGWIKKSSLLMTR